MKLTKVTDRVWFYPFEKERDRPILGYIKGDNMSIAVDAGHSEAHTKEFYSALEEAGLPLPKITVLTHWHWDHTFAMHSVNGICIANALTDSSANNAALTPLILSKTENNKSILGAVYFFIGVATFAGSFIASYSSPPKKRVKAICLSLFFSMSTENFILAFSDSPIIWCIGVVMGWLFMGANLDVVFRSTIPANMQGRVYACRNTMQFFTIPIGSLSSGALIDNFFEPFMSRQNSDSMMCAVYGVGKGSGAALLMAVLGVAGVAVCVIYSLLLKKEIFDNG